MRRNATRVERVLEAVLVEGLSAGHIAGDPLNVATRASLGQGAPRPRAREEIVTLGIASNCNKAILQT